MSPVVIAKKSAMGVAQGMPLAPASRFMRNMKGTSSPPLRSRDSSMGLAFCPVAWKMEMIIIVTEMAGQVMQMILRKLKKR